MKKLREIFNNYRRRRAYEKVLKRANFFVKQREAFRLLKLGCNVSYGGDFGVGATHLAVWSAALIALQNPGCMTGLYAETYSAALDRFRPILQVLESMGLGKWSQSNCQFTFKAKYGGSRIRLVFESKLTGIMSVEFKYIGIDCAPFHLNEEVTERLWRRGHRGSILFCNWDEPISHFIIDLPREKNPHLTPEQIYRMKSLRRRGFESPKRKTTMSNETTTLDTSATTLAATPESPATVAGDASDQKLPSLAEGWPKYQSHKKVHAAKIIAIEPTAEPGSEDNGDRILQLDANVSYWALRQFMERHKPQVGGYLVYYEDGYLSYSPAEPFESGYTPIEV